jgi:ABC-type branched-subunit amino acid transport system ATPase component
VSLLVVDRIEKRFGGVRAVDGVSFALAAGEFTAMIGPNGAGKSTLFAVIAGQYAADAGEVRYEGRTITGRHPAAHAHLGIGRTFQTAHVFGSMTVRENVQLALAARERALFDVVRPLWGRSINAADALLERVGLAGQAQRAADDLAYGDVKRLELALAMAGQPRLLLMDEPTAGMAAAERHALMDLVRTIARETGLTVLFTEHSMEVVFGYAQRVLVLSRGQLIAEGSPDAVRANPAAQAAYFGEAA